MLNDAAPRRLNIMTYDYASPFWSSPDVTGHNAPLTDANDYDVESNIKQWIAGGASPSKMTLGGETCHCFHVGWPISGLETC